MCAIIKGAIIAALTLFISAYSLADIVIVSPENKNAINIAKRLEQSISPHIPTRITSSLKDIEAKDLVVTLGNNTFIKSLKSPKLRTLPTFINYSDFNSHKVESNIAYVIYSDPSPKSISAFINNNFSRMKIGFIYTDSDYNYVQSIKSNLSKGNEIVQIDFDGNTFNGIKKLTKKNIDLFLIGRNRSIYKPKNVRFVLEALFRKNIPVLTTSAPLIKAGASVSISPNNEQLIERIAMLARKAHNNPSVAFSEQFETEYGIKINESMVDLYKLGIKEEVQ